MQFILVNNIEEVLEHAFDTIFDSHIVTTERLGNMSKL
jgi:hypothetical protein